MTTLNKMVLLIKKIKMIKMIKMINDYVDYLGSLHLITSTSVMVSPLEKWRQLRQGSVKSFQIPCIVLNIAKGTKDARVEYRNLDETSASKS